MILRTKIHSQTATPMPIYTFHRYMYSAWNLTYLDYSLIRTHVWDPIIIIYIVWLKSLSYPDIQLSGQPTWEQRCPDKWGSTVYVYSTWLSYSDIQLTGQSTWEQTYLDKLSSILHRHPQWDIQPVSRARYSGIRRVNLRTEMSG